LSRNAGAKWRGCKNRLSLLRLARRRSSLWPELGAFGVDWVKKWLVRRERLIEIAKVLRRFPWMVEVAGQRPMSILHPYTVEVYVARDGSEARLSLTSSKAYCAQNGSAREVKLSVSLLLFEEQRRVGIDYAYYIL
jgi:hypothetical protein